MLERALVQFADQLSHRRIQLIQREELAMPQSRQDPALHDQHRTFDLGLVARPIGAGGKPRRSAPFLAVDSVRRGARGESRYSESAGRIAIFKEMTWISFEASCWCCASACSVLDRQRLPAGTRGLEFHK
jgi:hypothetical protein